ncbi:MAG: Ig-like domain-containing protein, partial [Candidatus Aenigmatarchaeota archaeon]
MVKNKKNKLIFLILVILILVENIFSARYIERLDRGVVAVWLGNNRVWISWRILGTDPKDIGFNVYRNNTKINSNVIRDVSYFIDTQGSQTASYKVVTVISGIEVETSKSVTPWSTFYKVIPVNRPPGGTTPDGVSYDYSPNDASVGDLDGDGEYEIVLKWDPSNSKDNSQSGYTGNVYIDAYKLDGTFMWRIDLGINIRAGAHYTQFLVYDFDGDGKAEMMCKTAPGTKDGTGRYLRTGPAANDDDSADYRNSSGYILSGPEYLTVFRGTDGAEIITVDYYPPRGNVSSWGDSYGNRVDRFLACVAYLDGTKPSAVFQRGYYTRMVLAAWDFNGSSLTRRWVFDSNNSGYSSYAGQGNHNLSVGDVDNDGKDEIVEGACAINDDGTGMYTTGLGHGDAMHLGDLDPDRPGLEVWEVHESASAQYGAELHDARTGQIIWGTYTGSDNGRGLAADIDSRYRGYEMWSAAVSGVYSCKGQQISTAKPSINFRIYWDGDLLDEILDGTVIDKWNGNGTSRLLTAYNYNAAANNGTKNTPCLVADILGDWREEVIWRRSDNTALLLFTTTIETDFGMYTLMHDPQYRLSIAWQNVAYNQPPHLGFYLYDRNPPTPQVILTGTDSVKPVVVINTPTNNSTVSGVVSIRGTAVDNEALNRVLVYVDNICVSTFTITITTHVYNYNYSWDSTKVTNGSHTLRVVAYDRYSNSYSTQVVVNVNNAGTTTYQLTVNINPEGAGSVSLNPSGGVYVAGTTVTLTAQANSGWRFSSWSGAISSTQNPVSVVMSTDIVITANFVVIQPTQTYKVEVLVLPPAAGSVTLNPQGGVYLVGSTVTLTAVANNGYKFASWSGDIISTFSVINVVVSSKDISLVGIFADSSCIVLNVDRLWYNVGIGSYQDRLICRFKAQPLANNIDCPVGLSSGVASAYTDLACIVRFNSYGYIDVRNGSRYSSDISISYSSFSVYEVEMYIDVVNKVYDVYIDGQKIASGYSFRGEQVGITAIKNFGGRLNNGAAGLAIKDLVIEELKDTTYILDVKVSPSGAGSVSLNPSGGVYVAGTTVTVLAQANAGWVFSGWSGDLSGSQNPASIVMNSSKTVIANFVSEQVGISTYSLVV